MRLDFEPVRPRAVSVVAVVWLYLGPSWLLTGLAMTTFLTSAWHLTVRDVEARTLSSN
jgi:hypothetical protein